MGRVQPLKKALVVVLGRIMRTLQHDVPDPKGTTATSKQPVEARPFPVIASSIECHVS